MSSQDLIQQLIEHTCLLPSDITGQWAELLLVTVQFSAPEIESETVRHRQVLPSTSDLRRYPKVAWLYIERLSLYWVWHSQLQLWYPWIAQWYAAFERCLWLSTDSALLEVCQLPTPSEMKATLQATLPSGTGPGRAHCRLHLKVVLQPQGLNLHLPQKETWCRQLTPCFGNVHVHILSSSLNHLAVLSARCWALHLGKLPCGLPLPHWLVWTAATAWRIGPLLWHARAYTCGVFQEDLCTSW